MQVAELIGVTKCCIMYWETGRNGPTVPYIPKIIEFIGYCPFAPTRSLVERLKQIRWALGLSQRQVANILKTDVSNIVGWESEKHRPTKKSAELVERFLSRAGTATVYHSQNQAANLWGVVFN